MKCVTTWCNEPATHFYTFTDHCGAFQVKCRCLACLEAYASSSRTNITEQEFITLQVEAQLQATQPRG